jgi:Na+-transporting methylmalonyl-CoA/oxaloacetate decarboxylase gamma subunit
VDASLVSGLPMTLIGMGSVFIALAALVGVLKLTPRILGLSQTDTPRPVEPTPVGSLERRPAAGSKAPDDDLPTVALAAYAYHRRRQASARPPTAPSPWSSAGRSAQIAPFRR